MASGIYTALSGAVAQSTALDVNANNIANANTTGYHTVRARFDEVLTRARSVDQRLVVPSGQSDDTAPGNIVPTGNPLDVALQGDGYLAVLTPHGERFTRAGDLRLDSANQLVTADGMPIEGINGKPLVVPPSTAKVLIADSGLLTADGNEIGTIKLASFAPGVLKREGATLYSPVLGPDNKPTAPLAAPPPKVLTGSLEHANFSVVRGMVDLVKTSRTYEALHRMIESYKEIDDRAARSIGGNG